MTKRNITAHKGGRTARAPEARIRPQTLERIRATMQQREKSFADLLEETYSQGDDTMEKKFVRGWYHYADGTDKEFRYPAERESDLKQTGKAVTVEVKVAGAWDRRKGTVNWDGGNFVVTPR